MLDERHDLAGDFLYRAVRGVENWPRVAGAVDAAGVLQLRRDLVIAGIRAVGITA